MSFNRPSEHPAIVTTATATTATTATATTTTTTAATAAMAKTNSTASSISTTTLASKSLGWHNSVAGAVGGLTGAVVTAPFDVIRTRLQSSQSKVFAHANASKSTLIFQSRTLLAIRNTFATEGIRGFYLGLGPNLLGIIPSRAIQFTTYTQTKNYLSAANSNVETPFIHLLSGVSAGMVTATLTNPIWVIKTRMQLGNYKNSFDCLVQTLKKESVKGLYTGITASYLGTIEISIQWVLYEKFKKLTTSSTTKSSPNVWLNYLGSATASKLLASIIAYPHEVLRTRMRQMPMQYIDPVTKTSVYGPKYRTLVQSSRFILIEEGLRGFYGGLTPHLLKTVPNAAVMFVTFELVSSFLQNFQ